jgi:hypothetical protein
MAVEAKAPPEKKETKKPKPSPEAKQKPAEFGENTRFSRIVNAASRSGLMITLAVSLIANGIAFSGVGSKDDPAAGQLTPEVQLGQFAFLSSESVAKQVVKAEFAVHVALSEDMESESRDRMTQRQFRLQQDIEELLRGAHSGDFDDPLLRGLKQKLKERIDKTLGLRATAYVIITGLKIERNQSSPVKEEPSTMVPWVEPAAE